MIEHRSVTNLWAGLEAEIYRHHPHISRISLNAPLVFDASVQQIVQLASGRTLVIVPPEVRNNGEALDAFLIREAIELFDCTPAQLTMMYLAVGTAVAAEVVLVGGEAIGESQWQTMLAHQASDDPAAHHKSVHHKTVHYKIPHHKTVHHKTPHGKIIYYNLYGPSEATVDTTVARLDAKVRQPHLGHPMPNRRVYVLDPHGQPVPIGVKGEIYIGGIGLARGYVNLPQLTDERFISDPFVDEPQARMYRTGDFGRLTRTGHLEFLGRRDDQVKIRGFRIELGDVAAGICACDGVDEAVAMIDCHHQRLIGYYTGPAAIATDVLRHQVNLSLPDYMVPAVYLHLSEWPLTANGKIDRRALPTPDQTTLSNTGYLPPQGETEIQLATLWQQVLPVDAIGRRDHFFALGGHSLLAVKLVNTARAAGMNLTFPILFANPVLQEMAAALEQASACDDEIIIFRHNDAGLPLFIVPEASGLLYYGPQLTQAISHHRPVYGLPGPALDDQPLSRIESVARRYIRMIRLKQPQGPYRLLGWSLGGVIAYEIGRQLLEQGQQVAFLGLIDSYPGQQIRLSSAVIAEADQYHHQVGAMLTRHPALKALHHAIAQLPEQAGVQAYLALLQQHHVLPGDWTVDMFRRWLAHHRALTLAGVHYRPQPLAADTHLHLFTASEKQPDYTHDDHGWGACITPGKLRRTVVTGDHFSIMTGEGLRQIGREIH
jgi:thioesterase domain-containing protein/aryl carrier-like protein